MLSKREWAGPPIVVQILALLAGVLAIAQLVTLLLTLVLPPEPPRRTDLAEIAGALRGAATGSLERTIVAGPPDLDRPGWFVPERTRAELARRLGVPETQVALGFFTQFPLGTGFGPPPPPPPGERRTVSHVAGPQTAALAAVVPLLMQGPPGGGQMPGGGMPGGQMPGGGFPGEPSPRGEPRGGFPGRGDTTGTRIPRQTRDRAPDSRRSERPNERGRDAGRQPREERRPDGLDRLPQPIRLPAPVILDIPATPPIASTPLPTERIPLPDLPAPRPTPHPVVVSAPTPIATPVATAAPSPTPIATATTPATRVATAAPIVTATNDQPVPLPTARALFGLAPAPFVEGDFVAAMKLADGRWAVVRPIPEGFPNAWQRRVLLWFALSLLLTAPFAWIFARRIVQPLKGFAAAAETLGRDPAAAILPLAGPAEVGRAAHAFNLMQSRLRAFVDDRTAMVGAISHDLRTPLTRLRFRIEDVPEEQHPALLAEIVEMEAMIASVIDYIRDASTPNARERIDLAVLVDDVVEDAAMTGGDVATIAAEPAPVDVDALGMRRVLDNLLANAVKYGQRARVSLHIADAQAIADVIDDGPGIPDDELERVFEPFYRSESAKASGREGHGLGLAVCRSIARAHGGDVVLFRSAEGFVARVSVPLAFEADRLVA